MLNRNPPLSDYAANIKTMLSKSRFVENFSSQEKETGEPGRCAMERRLGVLHSGWGFVGFCNKEQNG